MASLETVRRRLGPTLTGPIVPLLVKAGITPNALTWLGLLVSVAAGVLAALGATLAAGIVVAAGGLFDTLDGALARSTGRVTRFGGILDSTLDRAGEAAVMAGILVLFARQGNVAGVAVAAVVWALALLVSYLRARAEAAGLECKVGLFTRPERVLALALGLLLGRITNALLVVLSAMAVLSAVTVVQRLHTVWRQTRGA